MKSIVKNKNLLIIGAGGHGKVVADIAKATGEYQKIIFSDCDDSIKECMGYPVIQETELKEIIGKDFDVIIAIGNSTIRARIQEELRKEGYFIPTLIHPQTVVSSRAIIGEGTVVMAGSVVNAEAKIGRGCILNTASSVDHDCVVGDFCHISVGAHLAGTVIVGTHTWIGIGACVNNNLNICEKCVIGAGAVVVNDIQSSGTYIGVPASKKG